jgi:hypothetical protein
VLANLMFALPAVTASATARSAPHLWLGEVVATAGLVLVVFALARSGRGALAPAAVAGWVGAAYWATSSTSFANPAVTIGRAFTATFAGIAPASVPGLFRLPPYLSDGQLGVHDRHSRPLPKSAVHLAPVAATGREREQGAAARDVGEHRDGLEGQVARELEPVVRDPNQDPARPQSLREPGQDHRQGQVMQGTDAGDRVVGPGGQCHLGDVALQAGDVAGNDPPGRLDHLRRPVHRVHPPGPLPSRIANSPFPQPTSSTRSHRAGSARSSRGW